MTGEGGSVIVFDTDGTLVDGHQAIIDAVADGLTATYRHFGLSGFEPDHERIALAMGLPASAFFRTAFAPDSVPAHLRDSFASEFEVLSTRAEVAALRRGESRLYPGAEDTLAALHERGYTLALFSNATQPYFETVIAVHGFERWFDRALCLEHAVRRRLARNKTGMVRHLARGFTRVTVVGDRCHDIEAGQQVGAATVGCRYGFAEPGELKNADWLIDHLSELGSLPLGPWPRGDEPSVAGTAR